MASDPFKRQVKCPCCGRLTPLDDRGRFVPHVGDNPRDWCHAAGQPRVELVPVDRKGERGTAR